MWPHLAEGSWGFEPEPERWRFSVSVHHSAGPLSLQPGCQISTTQKTQEGLAKEQAISAPTLRWEETPQHHQSHRQYGLVPYNLAITNLAFKKYANY